MGESRTEWPSRLVSRVLSWTVISLERELPPASSDLPGSGAGHTIAPCAVLHPTELARFTRVTAVRHCGAGPRLAADGCYPPSCPVVPGLSSAALAAATIRPARPVQCTGAIGQRSSSAASSAAALSGSATAAA